jgi:murein DD-endopeptidase MepM/ murein hydrolase activator NlpD
MVQLSEPAIVQGRTLVVKVNLTEPAALGGLFENQPVFFFNSGGNEFWGLAPIHALAEPRIYSLTLNATLHDGRTVSRTESINVVSGPYEAETINLTGNRADLLQKELIAQEQEKMVALWSQVTPRPLWQGPFRFPVAGSSPRVTSLFGTRRTYNDSAELSFHGGADFGGGVGAPIYAPAPGKVVLAQPLTVRGHAVLIDHGLGLFSGYWHQSEIVVVEGQEVQAGELIGLIGNTGLSTGPHLHWELRLNGIAVNPVQWVKETIP